MSTKTTSAPRIARNKQKDEQTKRQEALTEATKASGIESTETYKCSVCGSQTKRPGSVFYTAPFAKLSAKNGGFTHICKSCIKEIYLQSYAETQDPFLSLQICCHYMDVPYVTQVADKVLKGKSIAYPMPMYMRELLLPAYRNLSYADSIIEMSYIARNAQETAEEEEKNWDSTSLQNMTYVKKLVGYDPFDDRSLSVEDRKFLFNTMAGYCPDNSIAQDSHKLNSIIVIVKHLLQAEKVSRLINRELAKPTNKQTDMEKLSNIQKSLHQTIDRMAEKNNISKSKDTGASNTLTERMRRLQDDRFRDIEVNMYDIEQAKQLQELERMSMKAMMEAIALEDNDYSDIVNEQRETVVRLTKENKKLTEQVRVLTNKVTELEGEA